MKHRPHRRLDSIAITLRWVEFGIPRDLTFHVNVGPNPTSLDDLRLAHLIEHAAEQAIALAREGDPFAGMPPHARDT